MIKSKGTIIFKLFYQSSHYNSTWHLAKQLQESGYEIVYMTTKPMISAVVANGFKYFIVDEDDDMVEKEYQTRPKSYSIFSIFKLIYQLPLIRQMNQDKVLISVKKDHFKEVIETYNPVLFIVDSVFRIHVIQLFKYDIPFMMLNILVSLIRTTYKPPLNIALVPKMGSMISRFKIRLAWMYYHYRNAILSRLYNANYKDATVWLCNRVGYNYSKLDNGRYFGLGFNDIPELNTSPIEFDFPHDIPNNIHCIGPPVWNKRQELSCDYNYFQNIDEVLTREGHLIYCSFGTMCWRYSGYANFFRKLTKTVSKMKGVNLILTVEDDTLRRELRNKNYENIFVFRRVPQLDLLTKVDMMITHGGINSINECVLEKVPMLVYPGKRGLDQYGNSARVMFHEIGLKGVYSDPSFLIKKKIKQILFDKTFRLNLKQMNESIHKNKNYEKGVIIIEDYLKRYIKGN